MDESGQENTGDPPSATSEADITEPGSGEEEEGINLASEEEAKEADLNKGQVDVYIAQTLEWGEPVTFTVTLNGQNKEITLPSEGVREVQEGVTFDNLTEGLYALEVSAPGFATYKQQLQVKGWTYKVSLATGIIGGYDYIAGETHPGVVLIGDVNGNGVITEKDETELIDLIDQEKEPKDNPLADLNRDGKLDLTDLDYFVI